MRTICCSFEVVRHSPDLLVAHAHQLWHILSDHIWRVAPQQSRLLTHLLPRLGLPLKDLGVRLRRLLLELFLPRLLLLPRRRFLCLSLPILVGLELGVVGRPVEHPRVVRIANVFTFVRPRAPTSADVIERGVAAGCGIAALLQPQHGVAVLEPDSEGIVRLDIRLMESITRLAVHSADAAECVHGVHACSIRVASPEVTVSPGNVCAVRPVLHA
mmetsp:Transcript_14265/g.42073  ORF Transcript_14265/g.42073 Transcript_14265/m.42073 type:complete len:215 (-) Transcript_14265:843-1487(-)